jgi:hypothetical protein
MMIVLSTEIIEKNKTFLVFITCTDIIDVSHKIELINGHMFNSTY